MKPDFTTRHESTTKRETTIIKGGIIATKFEIKDFTTFQRLY